MNPFFAETAAVCAIAAFVLVGCNGGSGDEAPIPLTVPKASCGPNDRPETALQGQVSAALRASGFQGFSCNLQLIGQSKGDGANWQTAQFKDRAGHVCAYHGTAFTTAGRTHVGVPVIDITQPSSPTPTTYLTTTSMLDPWESLKVNERRQLLAGVNAHNGGLQKDNGTNGGGGPEIDVYDLSGDCRQPQFVTSVPVGLAGEGGTVADPELIGHEGEWAPDGLTYYGSDLVSARYYAIDMLDQTHPKLLSTFRNPFARNVQPLPNLVIDGTVHGLSVSDDGNRAYFVSLGPGNPDPAVAPNNGLLIVDTSEVQARKPNAQMKLISSLFWRDGGTSQHTINVKIGGKPYIVFVDEAGSGGNSPAGWAAACAANLPAWPFARIIDISNETAPKIVSRLMLEIHDPANCSKVLPDLAGLASFTYGSHYCSVDNRAEATTLACGYFNSGIRVFDIRDPLRPKEIAYYNPAGTTTASPGSNHVRTGGWIAGGPDWCSAQVHLDAPTATLWTTCQDNGALVLKFTNGAWPFNTSATPPGQQN